MFGQGAFAALKNPTVTNKQSVNSRTICRISYVVVLNGRPISRYKDVGNHSAIGAMIGSILSGGDKVSVFTVQKIKVAV